MRKPVYFEQLSLAPVPSGMESRRESKRIPAQGKVALSWIEDNGKLKEAWGELKDLSGNGLGLKSIARLPTGKHVLVDYLDGTGSWGVIRHCTSHNNAFIIGVEYAHD